MRDTCKYQPHPNPPLKGEEAYPAYYDLPYLAVPSNTADSLDGFPPLTHCSDSVLTNKISILCLWCAQIFPGMSIAFERSS